MMPDRLSAEQELACEAVVRFDASGLANCGLNIATITYDEAMERELEYRKRKGLSSMQPHISSSFQLLPSEPNVTGVMRKEAPQNLPVPVLKPANGQKMPSNIPQGRQAENFESLQLPGQQLQHQQLAHRQSDARQPLQQIQQSRQPHPQILFDQQFQQHNEQGKRILGQGQQYRQRQPNLSLNRQTPQHSTYFRRPPFWCNICEVNCETGFNLKTHRQGRKHRNKWEEIKGGKKNTQLPNNEMLWCKECNVPCMNERALADHLVGKKHMLQALQANTGASAAGTNMNRN